MGCQGMLIDAHAAGRLQFFGDYQHLADARAYNQDQHLVTLRPVVPITVFLSLQLASAATPAHGLAAAPERNPPPNPPIIR